jgi:hypothetical protein
LENIDRLKPVVISEKTKQGILLVVTGFAVSYTRHGLQYQWHAWESIEAFFVGWFVHTAGLLLFLMVAVIAIAKSYEFFLGVKRKSDDFDELVFMVLMTVLVGAIFIFVVAHWVPSDEEL